MSKNEFQEKYFIQEGNDLLSPTDAFRLHSEQIMKDLSTDQDIKDSIIRLNKEAEKCFRLLESAIYESLD